MRFFILFQFFWKKPLVARSDRSSYFYHWNLVSTPLSFRRMSAALTDVENVLKSYFPEMYREVFFLSGSLPNTATHRAPRGNWTIPVRLPYGGHLVPLFVTVGAACGLRYPF